VIWESGTGVSLPASSARVNAGTTAERTIDADGAPDLSLEFGGDVDDYLYYYHYDDTADLTLTLTFTDATSSTIPFSVDW
jgi:hypothetical protein